MNKKVILFDLDGTLIDSTEAILGCFYHSFKEMDFDFKGCEEDIKNEVGYPLDIMYKRLGIPKDDINMFVDSYKKRYRIVSKAQTILLENALESVKLASTFATLGVVTTKTTKYSIELLENFGIMKYFDTIVGREDVTNPKPDPEPIFKALKNLNTEPSKNIYMIGDTKLDLIASNSAGINGIAVLCGYGKKDELSQYTNNIFNNSLEAVKYIKKVR